MPGVGPSLVFAAGLAIGVGAGTFLPKRSQSETPVLPPPPVEKYDVVKKVPTAGGSAALQGGFPGMTAAFAFRGHPADLVSHQTGPTPDIIKRIAYTAAYDRRLKHPAWVSTSSSVLQQIRA